MLSFEPLRSLFRTRARIVLAACLALFVTAGVIGYIRLSRFVDGRLVQGFYGDSVVLYAGPRTLAAGDVISADQVVASLRESGYTESVENSAGFFKRAGDTLEIHPGPSSYFKPEAVIATFTDKGVTKLVNVRDGRSVDEYALEPQVLATLNGSEREKRRIVRFAGIPKVLVNALLAAEDKRFFSHAGFDPLRLVKAAAVDLKSQRKEQGGSTLTMQLARNLYLDSDKKWKRKASELMITLMLEHKLTKEQIFENYANRVYLGRSNGFSVLGFAKAAQVYFGKDLSQIDLPEAAFLAGMVQRPSYYEPQHHLARAIERRNVVLRLMRQNDFIDSERLQNAVEEPVSLAHAIPDTGEAPYFLSLALSELQDATQSGAAPTRVYTTLDPDLQRSAADAVRVGLKEVDGYIARRRPNERHDVPQVALIALDPHTGEVKAVIGGRHYGTSQLNHVLAKRQPGSIFKPFVYAAALSPGGNMTPASTVVDQPTTFHFGKDLYQPGNFGEHFYGTVTLRRALAKSMNIATVRVAEKVGYDKVVNVAHNAGLNNLIMPTPAVALGSYETTPLEMAGAYTVFANQGIYTQPHFLSEARDQNGNVIFSQKPRQHRALDEGVTFLMQDMLEEVLRSGTAASVKSRGLLAQAAGKTGTSRDGWFAGFTSDLVCIVWVGYDDNSDLDLEGARSALPIWTEFMKRATALRGAQPLASMPNSVVCVSIDTDTGLTAGPLCTRVRREYFLAGTQPRKCTHEEMPQQLEPVLTPSEPITTALSDRL